MYIMKKLCISLILMVVLGLGFAVDAKAETKWQITCDEELNIVEKVITDNEELSNTLISNGFEEERDEGYFYRQIEDWPTFNNLEKKFPIKPVTRNFIIFSVTTIYIDDNLESDILKDVDEPVKFQYISLGMNFKNTGQKVSEFTSEWNLNPGWVDSFPKPYLTKIVVFNGFMLGVFILIVGLICIAIVYLKTISRINKLIEEEYSIENYLAKQEKRNEEEK